jgi:purine catabolism regulator
MLAVGRELVGLDRAILEQAVGACAIDLAREEAATAARDEVQGDFLDDLLRGAFPSGDAIERRGRNLGYDLAQPHVVIALGGVRAGAGEVVELTRRAEPGGALDTRRPRDTAVEMADVAEALATVPGVTSPVAVRERGETVVVLVPLAPEAEGADPGRQLAAAIGQLWAGLDGARPSVGLGGVAAGGAAIAEAAERASQAATIGGRLFGGGSVTAFEDLGLYRLLFGLRGIEEVSQFYWDMLGKLIEHDRRTGGELVRTLDAYLSVGCSPTAAAEKLHLHRNGLLYRLQRIREIVPVNLDDPERRLALHLALRIGEVLEPAAAQVQRIA